MRSKRTVIHKTSLRKGLNEKKEKQGGGGLGTLGRARRPVLLITGKRKEDLVAYSEGRDNAMREGSGKGRRGNAEKEVRSNKKRKAGAVMGRAKFSVRGGEKAKSSMGESRIRGSRVEKGHKRCDLTDKVIPKGGLLTKGEDGKGEKILLKTKTKGWGLQQKSSPTQAQIVNKKGTEGKKKGVNRGDYDKRIWPKRRVTEKNKEKTLKNSNGNEAQDNIEKKL